MGNNDSTSLRLSFVVKVAFGGAIHYYCVIDFEQPLMICNKDSELISFTQKFRTGGQNHFHISLVQRIVLCGVQVKLAAKIKFDDATFLGQGLWFNTLVVSWSRS